MIRKLFEISLLRTNSINEKETKIKHTDIARRKREIFMRISYEYNLKLILLNFRA